MKALVLLQIETDILKNNLIFEESSSEERSGKFPHLYGKLAIKDICKIWNLKRSAFELPIEILKESEDIELTMTELTINEIYAIGAPIVWL